MELCRHAGSGNFISCSSYFVLVPKPAYKRFMSRAIAPAPNRMGASNSKAFYARP